MPRETVHLKIYCGNGRDRRSARSGDETTSAPIAKQLVIYRYAQRRARSDAPYHSTCCQQLAGNPKRLHVSNKVE